jgi:hypothetical protein
MTEITKTETVSITYTNDKITVTGKDFHITLNVSSAELFSIYMGNKGQGKATLTVDMPDPPAAESKVSSPEPATTPVSTPDSPVENKMVPPPVEVKEKTPDPVHKEPESKKTSTFEENGGIKSWQQGG